MPVADEGEDDDDEPKVVDGDAAEVDSDLEQVIIEDPATLITCNDDEKSDSYGFSVSSAEDWPYLCPGDISKQDSYDEDEWNKPELIHEEPD